jgi:hypothetical protein
VFVVLTHRKPILNPPVFTRFGGCHLSRFVAPDDVPFPMRALPRASEARPYTVYEVLKPLEDVPSGPAAPWFDQIGLGKQHDLPLPIQDLIDQGFIRPLTRVIPGN